MSSLTRYKQLCPKCGKSFFTCGGTPLPNDEQIIIDLLSRTQDRRGMIAHVLERLRSELRQTLAAPVAVESLTSTGATAEGIEAEWIQTLPWLAREILTGPKP